MRTLKERRLRGEDRACVFIHGAEGDGQNEHGRLLAKALNCTDGPSPNPPEDDPICQEIAAGSCLDVIEIDAASESGVDDVRRSIVEASEYRPSYCRYRIFIIDEVHDLSRSAFDALLKTIEERRRMSCSSWLLQSIIKFQKPSYLDARTFILGKCRYPFYKVMWKQSV